MAKATDIKAAIKSKLDGLVPATLKTVVQDDLKSNFENADIANYPAAILSSPSFSSDYLTNVENFRTYTFEILVLQKMENVSNPASDMENLIEAIIHAFDADYTLGGVVDGAIKPVVSEPAAVGSADQSYIAVVITIEASASISISS